MEYHIKPVLEEIERVAEVVDHHFHGNERWYGKIADNDEENAIENNLTPFRVTSGIGTYGTEVCVVGSLDVLVPGMTIFDLHNILFKDVQKAELYKFRLAYGTGTHAEAILASQYSTFMVNFQVTTGKTESLGIMIPRLANGYKVWISCWSVTNSQWADIFIGAHGYTE